VIVKFSISGSYVNIYFIRDANRRNGKQREKLMNRNFSALALATVLLTFTSANGQLIVNDSFATGGAPDYTAGIALGGQGPTNVGSGTTGVWENGSSIQVSDTGLTFADPLYDAASGGSVMVEVAKVDC